MRFYCIIVLVLLLNGKGFSQNPPFIIKSTDESNNINVQNVASNRVDFLPGYSYSPTNNAFLSNGEMDAYIGDGSVIDLPFNYLTNTLNTEFDRTLNTSLPVGSIKGMSEVTPAGGWQYVIPLKMAPGTAGVVPSVSLSYNSLSGNGVVGYGWNISGLSTIYRTPYNHYYQQKSRKIQQDNTDAISIDGNLLVYQVGTGSGHMTNGAEYLTHNETFNKVIAYDSDGNGPNYFEVLTKDGGVIEYGNTLRSRTISSSFDYNYLSWKINKTRDVNGNVIEYKYDNFDGNGYTTLLSEIQYGANEFEGTNHYCSVKFDYQEREDDNTVYINNGAIQTSSLLKSIEIWSEGQLVRKYIINYSYNLYSFLYEITEYDANGNQFNSTRFNYGNNELEKKSSVLSTSGITNETAEYRIGDYNGDGRTDISAFIYNEVNLQRTYTEWVVYLNNGSGYNKVTAQSSLPSNFYPFDPSEPYTQNTPRNMGIESFDMNGDGFDDLLLGEAFLGTTSYYIYNPYYSNGDGTFTEGTQDIIVNFDHEFTIGDFDGDKLLDLFVFNRFSNGANTWNVFFFDEESTDEVSQYTDIDGNQSSTPPNSTFFAVDYDGDGTTEILTTKGSYHVVFDITVSQDFNGSGSYLGKNISIKEIHRNTFPGINDLKFIGDMNGDNITDIVSNTVSLSNNWYLGYGIGRPDPLNNNRSYITSSAGNMNLKNPIYLNGNTLEEAPNVKHFVADINADGKADIVQLFYSFSAFQNGLDPNTICTIYLSDGNEFKPYTVDLPFYFNDKSTFNFGDFDGDGSTDLLYTNNGQVKILSLSDSPKNFLMSDVLDGFNNHTHIEYESLSGVNQQVYTKGSGSVYPIVDIQIPLNVVSEFSTEDGLGGRNTTKLEYKEARVHKKGKGFFGFKEVTSTNINSNTKIINTFNTDPDFLDTKLINTKVINTDNGFLMSESSMQYEKIALTNPPPLPAPLLPPAKRNLVLLASQTNHNYITGENSVSNYTYDIFGNRTSAQTSIGGGIETVEELIQYGQHGGTMPNRPESVIIRKQRTGDGLYQREKSFIYDSKGNLISETSDPGTNNEVVTSYTLNNFGQPLNKTISSSGLLPSTKKYIYDGKNRFVEFVTNTLGHVSVTSYDPQLGVPLVTVSVDGLTTTNEYDGFGRLVKTIDHNGNISEIKRTWRADDVQVTSNDPLDADDIMYEIVYSSQGAPIVYKRYNSVGYEREVVSEGFTDEVHLINTFNNRGLTYATTTPFYLSTPTVDITYTLYDSYGRVKNVSNSAGNGTTTYNSLGLGYRVINNNPDGSVTSVETDASGKMIKSTDQGGELTYTYFSNGEQKEIQLDGVSVALMQYDNYARQTQLSEPNSGVTNYLYNAYNQLVEQEDANGNIYQFEYDQGGRVFNKVTPEGNYIYSYVSTGNGLEQIKQISAPNGFSTLYEYDGNNRVEKKTEIINGQNFIHLYEYDQFDRMYKETYPSGYVVLNHFDSKGFLTRVTDDQNNMIWEGVKQSAFGNFIEYNKGNGITTEVEQDQYGLITRMKSGNVYDLSLTYDYTNGNVLSRTDNIHGLSELFQYDNLSRLTDITFNGNTVSTSYTSNGNLDEKFDVGTYVYDNTKINAVIEVENDQNTIPAVNQDIGFSSFHSPVSMEEGDYFLGISYGPDEQRRQSSFKYQGQVVNIRAYVGDMERNTDASGNVIDVHYVSGGTGLVAIVVKDANGYSTYYPYQDHLGSICTVTDDNGAIIYEQNFDAWGRKRDALTWSYTLSTTAPDWLYRGYTFHEELPEFGLINMNGRVYDPIIGRMISADNYVHSGSGSQGFNRYTYALNNPLKYTDPDGEYVHLILGGIKGGAISYIEGRNAGLEGWGLFGYTVLGVGTGVLSAAINPASIAGQGAFVKPDIATGSHGGGIGLEVGYNFGFGSGFLTTGLSSSAAIYYSARHQGTGKAGVYGRLSLAGGVNLGGGFGMELFTNQYIGGGISQRNGGVRLGFGQKNLFGNRTFVLTYENDFPGPLGDKGDRYRSAAARLEYYGKGSFGDTPLSVGFNLFTGDPGLDPELRKDNFYQGIGLHAGRKVYYEDERYRLGSLYFGYGRLKVGMDAEEIRHAIQNEFAHDKLKNPRVPHFQVIDKSPRFYWYYGNSNSTSLWGF